MKKALVYILTVLCTLSFVQCTCAEGVQVGTVLTAPAPYDLTVVLPEDMTSIGSTDSFLYGYMSADMLVGLTPVDYTDFDQLYAERIGEGFAEETELTINGMEARLYTPPADYGIAAIYEVRAGEENSILELAFYPRDLSATAENQADIDQIIGTLRSRTVTLAEDFDQNWTIAFSHSDTGVAILLPESMVKLSHPQYDNSVTEYQNDYISMLVFAYEGTVDQYVEEYQMNAEDFHIVDMTVNGTAVHVFQPKSASVSTDCAYVVAEGKDGTLLEIVFGANDPTEEDENWKYINQIIMNIATL